MSDAMTSTRSSRYFPLPDIPNFDKAALTPSLAVLANHPKYRDTLGRYEKFQWDVVENLAGLANAWEDIAKRYVNVDPAEDTEVDIMTGDTLYKGKKIEVEEDEDDPYEDETSTSDDEDDAAHVAGSRPDAEAEGDDDEDELGLWGPESGIEVQFARLPDLSALVAMTEPSQEEVDAFLNAQSERTRLQEESASSSRLESDDHVENEIIAAESSSQARPRRSRWRARAPQSENEDAGSPLKKRRIHGAKRGALQQHASSLMETAGPSSDAAQICSDALNMDLNPSSPFLTPKRAIHRARRGRPSNLTSAPGRTALNGFDNVDIIIDRSRLDHNLIQSATITPYISRSSRVVKQPRRWGLQIPWSQLRKSGKAANTVQIDREATRDQRCYVKVPDLPADWREYARVVVMGPPQASSPIALVVGNLISNGHEEPRSPVKERDDTPVPASDDLREPLADDIADIQHQMMADSREAEAALNTILEMPQEVDVAAMPQIESETQIILIPGYTESMSSLTSPLTPLTSCPPSAVCGVTECSSPRSRTSPSPALPIEEQAIRSEDPAMQTGEIDKVDEATESTQLSELLQVPSSSCESYPASRRDSIESHAEEAANPTFFPTLDRQQIQFDFSALEHSQQEIRSGRDTADQITEGAFREWSPPIFCKFEAMLEPDDDPLNANTMDNSLDELNLSIRRVFPLSFRLPEGAKGAAYDNPILVDDNGSDDELGGWDDVGW
jgi:hypothetical protein